MVAAQEALQRFTRLVVYTPDLRIAVTRPFVLLWRYRAKLPAELLWRATIIESYNPTVVQLDPGETHLPPGLTWDPANVWEDVEGEEDLEELRQALSTPARLPRRALFEEGPFVHVAFDGGAPRGGIASTGFVIADCNGKEVLRRGRPLGLGRTNNEAESAACLDALHALSRLQDAGTPALDAPIRVLGDSQLIIRMLLGVYKKVRKASLYLTIVAIQELVRSRKWVLAYRAVPRALNEQADDMCRRAAAANEVVEFELGALPEGAPSLDVAALYIAVAGADAPQAAVYATTRAAARAAQEAAEPLGVQPQPQSALPPVGEES